MLNQNVKTYVLDTSVLIHSPSALLAFEENSIIIPYSVLNDLGKLKARPGEIGANAKECNRMLSSLCAESKTRISDGIKTADGGTLRVEGTADESPIQICLNHEGSILVTQDENQRVKANVAGVKAESYKHGQVNIKNGGYTGRACVMVSSAKLSEYASKGELPLSDVHSAYNSDNEEVTLIENQFVIIQNASDPSHTMLGRVSGNKIVKLRYVTNSPVFGVQPRNVGQRFALEALLAPASEAPLVILKGPAGTAKTFLAMAAGLQQTYEQNPQYKRILVSRPNTKFDDDIGYLKGDEQEKIGPLIRPIMDNLSNLMPTKPSDMTKDGQRMNDPATDLFNNGVIVAQAMAYMRGRSICDNYIVIDEAQNASVNQILGLITRVGEGSKIVILGDPDQIDHPYLDRLSNGLSFASEHMKGSPLCWQLTFEESECTRSKLAAEAIARLTQD